MNPQTFSCAVCQAEEATPYVTTLEEAFSQHLHRHLSPVWLFQGTVPFGRVMLALDVARGQMSDN